MTTHDPFQIRSMRPDELALTADWAAAEGWNPGLADSHCFATVDPEGFLIGEFDGKPAATISIVNYDEHFAFLGFYIVRPNLRGQGLGWRIWQAAMAHAGKRVVGLDGVVAQQDNYRKSGFQIAHRNIRYAGSVPAPGAEERSDSIPLKDIPLPLILADDATVYPASRRPFLEAWIGTAGHVGKALLRGGSIAGWGVIRPCHTGFRVGPLFADDHSAATAVLAALLTEVGGGEIFIDVPEPNFAAIELAKSLGLTPVFETARMYTGAIRPINIQRVFGITTLELG